MSRLDPSQPKYQLFQSRLQRHSRILFGLGFISSLFFMFACHKSEHSIGHHAPILEKVLRTQAKVISPKRFSKISKFDHKQLISVDWKHPKRKFQTLRRTAHLQRFPCSQCHTSSGLKPSTQPASKPTTRQAKQIRHNKQQQLKWTHGLIKIKHASKGTLQCKSCHDPKSMNHLRTPSGKRIGFDQAYKLCSSCHSKQANDWAGGSHGKRLKHWFGKRVVKNCTSCHDPHSPLFGKRWPKTFFRVPYKLK